MGPHWNARREWKAERRTLPSTETKEIFTQTLFKKKKDFIYSV